MITNKDHDHLSLLFGRSQDVKVSLFGWLSLSLNFKYVGYCKEQQQQWVKPPPIYRLQLGQDDLSISTVERN